MSINTATDKLSLKFSFRDKHRNIPLSEQVQQISSERGVFRNISELALKTEIEDLSKAESEKRDEGLVEADSDGDDDPQVRREKLWKSRSEMLQKLSYAQNEILSALDFVSLLLSNHTMAAQTTMSPTLKELVPPKTLDGRIVKQKALSNAQREQLQAAADGWKSESFLQASMSFDSASSRLKEQTERQGMYWEQIAYIQSKGWLVSRFPTDSRTIGVHFGFQESSSQFRAKGFAPLRQDDEGGLHLDTRLLASPPKVLKVVIVRNGIETGSYRFPTTSRTPMSDIESELTSARDLLFDQELFYEISREARLLANQDVRTQAQSVEADIDSDYRIQLVHTGLGEVRDGNQVQKDDSLAQVIAYCFRYLLIAEHRRHHAERAQPPPPMSLGPSTTAECTILRPVLAQLRHEHCKEAVTRLFMSYVPSFKSAGLSLDIGAADDSAKQTNSPDALKFLRSRLKSSITMKLDTLRSITIHVETFLGSPVHGTVYEIEANTDGSDNFSRTRAERLEELTVSVANFLELALVSSIASLIAAETAQTDSSLTWKVAHAILGEFLVSRKEQNIAKAVVGLRSKYIFFRYAQATGKAGSKVMKKAFTWKTDGRWTDSTAGSKTPSHLSLKDTLLEANKIFQS